MGFNPLLVTYNGNNYSDIGLQNVQNMREVFGCDHIFFTPAIKTLKSLNRLGMLIMGDMNWHAHCGILTYPIKVAVEKKIPLMIWGEHGFADLGGMFSYDDFIEFTYRNRHEHGIRGFEWNDILEKSSKYGEVLIKSELQPWIYPSDEEINSVGVRGIFISNYLDWNANEHTQLVIEKYGFKVSQDGFERTYRKASNLDDIHENGIHDYLKFIKFGYGRATDHTTKDIRSKKLTREKGIQEVIRRDHIKPRDLKRWLKYVGWTEKEFDTVCDTFRDPRVWWIKDNHWVMRGINGSEFIHEKVLLEKNQWYKFYVE
ncbi:MAG: LPS biosynthesis protein [Candidatus Marinimicrobia bacterium]|nr:LPS biosynthesis protein [Candidatus Neomarinimicrobiota bacterium]